MRSSLIRHPDLSCEAVTAIEVRVERTVGGIVLQYALRGNMDALSIPALVPSRRADSLWQHTCCEAFVNAPDQASYIEFNFSPSSEWAAYQFDSYRSGMRTVLAVAPIVEVHRRSDRLELRAHVDVRELDSLAMSEWRVGVSAVIEERSGDKSYWALRHAPGKPDFHRADTFSLLLDVD